MYLFFSLPTPRMVEVIKAQDWVYGMTQLLGRRGDFTFSLSNKTDQAEKL